MRIRRLVVSVLACAVGAVTLPIGIAGAKTPDEWDDRIKRLVRFVERDRGLEFKHPVEVEFLSDAALRKRLKEDEEELTAADKRDIEEIAGTLRAVGLLTSDVDLLSAQSELDAESVLGYYDLETESMVIRGKDLDDVEVRTTVVHELVHALQDQYYGLDELYENADDSGEIFALDALTEGDAVLVEGDYVATLPPEEQDVYFGDGGESEGPPSTEVALPDDTPPALVIFSDAPYSLGQSFLFELDAIGRRALERAYKNPPVSEEQIIDPVAWAERDRPLEVAAPKLLDGERKSGPADVIGAMSLYLMLASRIDPFVALDAATGWGGDRYRGFTRGEQDCVRATIRGDTARDTTEIADALDTWAAAMPAGMAQIERTGESVGLTSCAVDRVSEPDVVALDHAFYFVLDWGLYNAAQAIAGGEPPELARCFGEQAVSDPELAAFEERVFREGLTPEDFSEDELARYEELIQEAFVRCDS